MTFEHHEQSGQLMYHEAELCSSLELTIDVTPKIHSPSEAIYGCIEFLESHRVDNESIQSFRLALSEALANALEHGIMRLPSSIKDDLFAPRHREGECVKSGQIILKLRLLHEDGDCKSIKAIGVEVADTGQGFDWKAYLQDISMPAPEKNYGRGLALIKMAATNLSFNEAGNTIRFIMPCRTESGPSSSG
jgi:anti-sigma regulatory factor (Ser/Thr protein kinase)